MAKKYVCDTCDTLYDNTYKSDKACSLCIATPPCTKDHTTYCGTCNGKFLREKCFQNHLTLKVRESRWRQVCRNCSFTVTSESKHECFKKFCNYWNKKQPSGHFCCLAPLKPSKLTDKFMYVFFEAEWTQDLEKCDRSFEHVPNLMRSANVSKV